MLYCYQVVFYTTFYLLRTTLVLFKWIIIGYYLLSLWNTNCLTESISIHRQIVNITHFPWHLHWLCPHFSMIKPIKCRLWATSWDKNSLFPSLRHHLIKPKLRCNKFNVLFLPNSTPQVQNVKKYLSRFVLARSSTK